ncbi:ASCH domain-containing protein [Alkalicoccobacillus plakortidis]|uniref:ASCH domain-containing protein n=1 Tax=Alkalicoccobacillus plakortidis TaxID=444060 RepID=A0ABT0XPY4_9BACI|nr:ASCH domain-containing protein [Alkalicoccobacillus plakortidis]MCM2677964.1 ASCH domain-containing protein [Alkalicoccobacillus plakortidis]
MNELATNYWREFWGKEDLPQSVDAGQFGDDPDYLAELVLNGTKTATCYGAIFYELEKKRIPQPGDYSIILDSTDCPLAIIQLTRVDVVPMNEVTEAFAIAEGDGSYKNWYDIHKRYFYEKSHEVGIEFQETMNLVCQTFELIDVKAQSKRRGEKE